MDFYNPLVHALTIDFLLSIVVTRKIHEVH